MKIKPLIKRAGILSIPLLLLSTMATTCLKDNTSKCHYTMRISNLSDADIYVCKIWRKLNGEINSINGALTSEKYIAARTVVENLLRRANCFEMGSKEEYSIFRNDTILIGIVDRTIGETKTDREIIDQKLFLQLYYLSIEDLKRLDFTVYYPPTSFMKEMKMDPEYSEKK